MFDLLGWLFCGLVLLMVFMFVLQYIGIVQVVHAIIIGLDLQMRGIFFRRSSVIMLQIFFLLVMCLFSAFFSIGDKIEILEVQFQWCCSQNFTRFCQNLFLTSSTRAVSSLALLDDLILIHEVSLRPDSVFQTIDQFFRYLRPWFTKPQAFRVSNVLGNINVLYFDHFVNLNRARARVKNSVQTVILPMNCYFIA